MPIKRALRKPSSKKSVPEKRAQAKKNPRLERVIMERGLKREELPREIKEVVNGILDYRRKMPWKAFYIALGSAYDMYRIAQGSKAKPVATISAALFAAIDALASDVYIRKAIKKLEQLIAKSDHPKIVLLRTRYPFFLIDRHGNLIFTDRKRILRLFGRLRGKTQTSLQREFPKPEDIAKRQKRFIKKDNS